MSGNPYWNKQMDQLLMFESSSLFQARFKTVNCVVASLENDIGHELKVY